MRDVHPILPATAETITSLEETTLAGRHTRPCIRGIRAARRRHPIVSAAPRGHVVCASVPILCWAVFGSSAVLIERPCAVDNAIDAVNTSCKTPGPQQQRKHCGMRPRHLTITLLDCNTLFCGNLVHSWEFCGSQIAAHVWPRVSGLNSLFMHAVQMKCS